MYYPLLFWSGFVRMIESLKTTLGHGFESHHLHRLIRGSADGTPPETFLFFREKY